MQYQLTIPALMDFFCQGEHQGFTEEDIRSAEEKIGASLPVHYRDFLKAYGLDPINQRHNHINHPAKEIVTSYASIQSTLEDWEEEFREAKEQGQEERYKDNEYFALWQLPQEKWSAITDNYVLLWYENQGVWVAGYRLSDLQAGFTNPPLYISTNDDDIAFAKCADDLDTFLLSMLWDAAYGYNKGIRLTDPAQIDAALSQAGITPKCLEWRGQLSVCLDDEGETLYFCYINGDYRELRTANHNMPAPQTAPSIGLPPRPKYVPKGPYHVEYLGSQDDPAADSIHIHPLIALMVGRGSGRHLLVKYDWMKAIGKRKGLCLGLENVMIEPDGIAHVHAPFNLPSCFHLDPTDWSIIEKMPNLQTLRIENLIVDDFSFLPKCKNLQVLSLYNTNFTDCRMLLELPKLKEADLRFCPLEHEEVLQTLNIRLV